MPQEETEQLYAYLYRTGEHDVLSVFRRLMELWCDSTTPGQAEYHSLVAVQRFVGRLILLGRTIDSMLVSVLRDNHETERMRVFAQQMHNHVAILRRYLGIPTAAHPNAAHTAALTSARTTTNFGDGTVAASSRHAPAVFGSRREDSRGTQAQNATGISAAYRARRAGASASRNIGSSSRDGTMQVMNDGRNSGELHRRAVTD